MTGRLHRTGNKILFLDCHIGHPFFAHDKFWVRTDYDAAATLGSSLEHTSVCTFTIDEEDRLVEEVTFEVVGQGLAVPED